MRVITIKLTDEVHKELKHTMINNDTTFQDYVSKLINDELKRSRELKNIKVQG